MFVYGNHVDDLINYVCKSFFTYVNVPTCYFLGSTLVYKAAINTYPLSLRISVLSVSFHVLGSLSSGVVAVVVLGQDLLLLETGQQSIVWVVTSETENAEHFTLVAVVGLFPVMVKIGV